MLPQWLSHLPVTQPRDGNSEGAHPAPSRTHRPRAHLATDPEAPLEADSGLNPASVALEPVLQGQPPSNRAERGLVPGTGRARRTQIRS